MQAPADASSSSKCLLLEQTPHAASSFRLLRMLKAQNEAEAPHGNGTPGSSSTLLAQASTQHARMLLIIVYWYGFFSCSLHEMASAHLYTLHLLCTTSALPLQNLPTYTITCIKLY
jgi:hypothetical protein